MVGCHESVYYSYDTNRVFSCLWLVGMSQYIIPMPQIECLVVYGWLA